MSASDRRQRYGEIRDYQVNWSGDPSTQPSDDTQLTFWTLDQLVEDPRFVPERLAWRFASERIFGIGGAVASAMERLRADDRHWYECGTSSAGNGALMRIAPMLVPHLSDPSADVWADTALSAVITHNDASSTSACLAFVAILWQLLAMDAQPAPQWWCREYVRLARGLEGQTRCETRTGSFAGYSGPVWKFVQERLADAESRELTALDACSAWGSGSYLLETVPSVLHLLALHAASPEEAIVRAVNDTTDNDTIGAIVGAAVGALHGASALPTRWVEALSGRTRSDDHGEVQRIIRRARAKWECAPA